MLLLLLAQLNWNRITRYWRLLCWTRRKTGQKIWSISCLLWLNLWLQLYRSILNSLASMFQISLRSPYTYLDKKWEWSRTLSQLLAQCSNEWARLIMVTSCRRFWEAFFQHFIGIEITPSLRLFLLLSWSVFIVSSVYLWLSTPLKLWSKHVTKSNLVSYSWSSNQKVLHSSMSKNLPVKRNTVWLHMLVFSPNAHSKCLLRLQLS